MQKVPTSEIANRIVSFQHMLWEQKVAAAIIRQNADLFYLTGTVQDGVLFVPAIGEPVFFVRRDFERAKEQSPLRPIFPLKSLRELPDRILDNGYEHLNKVGLELDVMPATIYFFFRDKLFPKSEIVDISLLIRQIRMIKSGWEIEMMRKAAAISYKVAEAVPGILKERMSQVELSIELERVARKHGHLGLTRTRAWNMDMFFGHILAGADAAAPAYADAPTGGIGTSPSFGQGASFTPIRSHEVISVDTMINYEGYLSDQTRNFCLGEPEDKLKNAYEVALEMHRRLKKRAFPGVISGELFQWVCEEAERFNLLNHFLGTAKNRVNFVGHGLGIEVDEFPFIAKGHKTSLAPGMTFAFEPKFTFPNLGIVGLENTYLVTSEGIESFNTFPEELMIL